MCATAAGADVAVLYSGSTIEYVTGRSMHGKEKDRDAKEVQAGCLVGL